MNRPLKMAAIVATVSLTLTGCASSPSGTSSADNQALTAQLAKNIDGIKLAIAEAEKVVSSGKKTELDWFASNKFSAAEAALNKAKSYYAEFANEPSEANDTIGFFNSKTNLQAAQENLDLFSAEITNAEAIRVQVVSTLEEALSGRKQLQKIGADSLYPADYAQVEKSLKTLVDQVADNKADSAIAAQPVLVSQQRTLEVKTTIKVYLSDAEDKLTRLERAQTAHYAPRTLADASNTLLDAKAFIATQPRATGEIKEKAAAVMFAINHTEQVTTAVKKLQATPQSGYEEYILNIENKLLAVSNELGAVDSRDKAFSQQSRLIVEFIKNSMQNERAVQLAHKALQEKIKVQSSELDATKQQLETTKTTLADTTAYAKSLENRVTSLIAQLNAMQLKAASEDAQAKQASANVATTNTPVEATKESQTADTKNSEQDQSSVTSSSVTSSSDTTNTDTSSSNESDTDVSSTEAVELSTVGTDTAS